MKIRINNEELKSSDDAREAEGLIKNFLNARGMFITRISVNDIPVENELIDVLSLKGVEKVEITAENLNQLIHGSIDEALNYLPKLTGGLNMVADLFQQGKENQGTDIFIQALEGLEWVTNVLKLLEQNKVFINQKEYQNIFAGLQAKLEQLVEAWENRDYVLIGDLLIYEIVPALEDMGKTLGSVRQNLG